MIDVNKFEESSPDLAENSEIASRGFPNLETTSQGCKIDPVDLLVIFHQLLNLRSQRGLEDLHGRLRSRNQFVNFRGTACFSRYLR